MKLFVFILFFSLAGSLSWSLEREDRIGQSGQSRPNYDSAYPAYDDRFREDWEQAGERQNGETKSGQKPAPVFTEVQGLGTSRFGSTTGSVRFYLVPPNEENMTRAEVRKQRLALRHQAASSSAFNLEMNDKGPPPPPAEAYPPLPPPPNSNQFQPPRPAEDAYMGDDYYDF